MDTQKSPISQIMNSFDVSFFKAIEESVNNSFAQAQLASQRMFKEPEQVSGRAQLRHCLCESGMREVAENFGLVSHALHTEPRGGRYSVIQNRNIFILRTNIQTHCGTPRATKFRQEWSQFNAWLEPQQMDLFQEVKEPPADRLCAMLVVSAQNQSGDQELPAYVGIGVPHSDLSGWIFRMSISEILALYHDQDTEHSPQHEPQVIIKDKAFPVLKKKNDGKN